MLVVTYDDNLTIERIVLIDTQNLELLDSKRIHSQRFNDSTQDNTPHQSLFHHTNNNEILMIGNWRIYQGTVGILSDFIVSPYTAPLLFCREIFGLENTVIANNTVDYRSNLSINGSFNISKVQLE